MGEQIKIDPKRFGGPSSQKRTQEEVQTAGAVTSTARGQADLPYIAPKAETDLTDARLKVLRDLQQNAREELKTFEGLDIVKTYDQGMRYFATALTVPSGREGDQDLVTLAAKVQDPTGAVMQGDIERYNDLQVALEYIPQRFRDQLKDEGRFTPETRRNIIAFMRNRVNTYRQPYAETRRNFEQRIGQFNAQIEPLGLKPINADAILPGDPLTLYQPKIAAYEKKLEADRIKEGREAGGPRAGFLEGVPEGMQVVGEDVQGWRFSPESEAELTAYARSPNATAAGYAQLMADKVVAEGHATPSERDEYARRMTALSEDFFKLPPEQRAKAGGIDYSDIDKAATENAGLIEGVAQSIRNIPESAYQLLEGVTAIPKDVVVSALEGTRTGTVKSFTDLAMELGQGNLDGPTTQAFAKALEDRYGSLDAVQRTGTTDPLGFLGDVSMILSAGGTAGARLPGVAGRIGTGVSTAGRAIDPLSAIAAIPEASMAAYRAASTRMPSAMEGIENLPSNVAAFPSGSGGAAIREATGAGFERGVTGAPTARSEALTEGMRRPGDSAENIVYTARDAIRNLRDAASQAYTTAMQQFGQNPVPLDIDVVRQRMAGIKPRNYDAMVDAPKRPPEHEAWEQMNNTVEYYAQQAAADPSLLEPMAMDQFKQDLYEIGSKIGGQYDKSAANIARTAYNAVRQELVKHDPIYADTMRDYERAAVEARELEDTFSLGQARGKPLKVDTAARKLQSILRNNAFTNYGLRTRQGERIAELDTTGTFDAALAGQMLSSPTARGVTNAVVAGGLPLTAATITANPLAALAAVPLLAATSPRLAGEVAYAGGRLAGTGRRAFDTVAQSPLGQGVVSTGRALADMYQNNPALFLAGAQTGTRLQETEAELNRQLAEQYGLIPPAAIPVEGLAEEEVITPEAMRIAAEQPALGDLTSKYAGNTVDAAGNEAAPAAAPGPKAGDTIVVENRDAVYDPVAKAYIFVDTGEIARKAMQRGGMVQGYQEGGRVGETAFQRRQREQQERYAGASRRAEQQMEAQRQATIAANQRNVERAQQQGRGRTAAPQSKQTTPLDDLAMAMSRRANNLVMTAADLYDRYAPSLADATAWAAENIEGRSPEQVDLIRRNLQPLNSLQDLVSEGAYQNELRFADAGGTGARGEYDIVDPVSYAAIGYRPQDVVSAAASETPGMIDAARDYLARSTISDIARDAKQGALSTYEIVRDDPYTAAINALLYSRAPIPTLLDDYATMRGQSQGLDPYLSEDPTLARDKRMYDAYSALPPLGVVPGARMLRPRLPARGGR